MPLVMAVKVMERDHVQNASIAADASDEDMVEFCETLRDVHERYEGLASMFQAAQLRVMAGMARHLVETGQA